MARGVPERGSGTCALGVRRDSADSADGALGRGSTFRDLAGSPAPFWGQVNPGVAEQCPPVFGVNQVMPHAWATYWFFF